MYEDLKKELEYVAGEKARTKYITLLIMEYIILFLIIVWSHFTFHLSPSWEPFLLRVLTILMLILLFLFIHFLIYIKKLVRQYRLWNEVQTEEDMRWAFNKKEIMKVLKNYHNYKVDVLRVQRIEKYTNYLLITFEFGGKRYTEKVTSYARKKDNQEKRIEAHIVSEDVMYGFLTGNLRDVTLYNF